MQHSEELDKLMAALSKAQAEFPRIGFDSTNPFLKNKYASLGAVVETIKPVMEKHGLALMQFPVSADGRVGVNSVLGHSSGQWISDTYTMEVGQEKGKSEAQLVGSIISYLRRYGIVSILGLYADEDNDGNKVTTTTKKPLTFQEALEEADPDTKVALVKLVMKKKALNQAAANKLIAEKINGREFTLEVAEDVFNSV